MQQISLSSTLTNYCIILYIRGKNHEFFFAMWQKILTATTVAMPETWYETLDREWQAKWAEMEADLNANVIAANNFNAKKSARGDKDEEGAGCRRR